MLSRIPVKELLWLVPFLCIGLAVTALLRPAPVFPAPAQSRMVTDAQGIEVPIAKPFRGIVLTSGAWGPGGYLENTHAPQTMNKIGNLRDRALYPKGVIYWIYPEVETTDRFWDMRWLSHNSGRNAEIETLLADDAGAYLGNGGDFGVVPTLRRLGLPALTLCWKPKNWDECTFSAARVETYLIGQPERGESLIARYKQAFADLAKDLRRETLKTRPPVLIMGGSRQDWSHIYQKSTINYPYFAAAGTVNAVDRFRTWRFDPESILIMDPDYIFLMGWGERPRAFERDPRWRGLKAVREKHVYTLPGRDPGGGGLAGLIFQPLWARWMAEIVHPNRLQPKLREMIRARLMTEFGYRLSDVQIDELLRLKDNSSSAGYARFTRNDLASKD